ncbi:methionyl-tRNA formyltransferase [Snodgrassella alvi]|uniref:Methionyl-tRNA formyltransferase n=1 Tax=Snodgrassella alvi TaxID=1196083 RepID=A0A2N9Y143_9NEIS|nr:methionyl-tRNA formyltransferase [Snodgrassella alvi]PIT58781.1 methionyl-tRNA formyltransferase [Snodgrassella alvi]
MKPSVIFAGTPDFAAAALDAIVAAGFDVPLVLTQPDRPCGRGLKLQPSAVKKAALAHGLTVIQPSTLKTAEAQAILQEQNADVMVVAAYGLLLPQAVLDIPRYGCLNIHASLLPRWRGAAPIQRAIEAGDQETGVCIMQMDAGLDTGAVISRHIYTINSDDTAAEVHDALMHLGANAIVADLQQIARLQPMAQSETGVTYAHKLSKAEAQINWTRPATEIVRKIRAFNPVPGAWTVWQDKPLKIWRAQVTSHTGASGTVLHSNEHELIIACGCGAISIKEIQKAGSKAMPVAAFQAGHTLQPGTVLTSVETNT